MAELIVIKNRLSPNVSVEFIDINVVSGGFGGYITKVDVNGTAGVEVDRKISKSGNFSTIVRKPGSIQVGRIASTKVILNASKDCYSFCF